MNPFSQLNRHGQRCILKSSGRPWTSKKDDIQDEDSVKTIGLNTLKMSIPSIYLCFNDYYIAVRYHSFDRLFFSVGLLNLFPVSLILLIARSARRPTRTTWIVPACRIWGRVYAWCWVVDVLIRWIILPKSWFPSNLLFLFR